jgi:FkbH-like protein
VDLTSADAERSGQYAAEASRKRIQSEAATPEQYLSSLEMRAEVQPVDPSNMDRVVDLITKTNQFNLTTRRHSRAAVEEMAASPRNVCFAVKLTDKFGDYGLVAAVLAVAEDETTLNLDTWLMSCRAMGRTVEHFTLNHLVEAARNLEYAKLIGEYLPTAKNVPVKTLLPDFGFVPEQGSKARWALNVGTFVGMPSQVTSWSVLCEM